MDLSLLSRTRRGQEWNTHSQCVRIFSGYVDFGQQVIFVQVGVFLDVSIEAEFQMIMFSV